MSSAPLSALRAVFKRPLLVDVHTHVYTPRLVDMMRRRTEVPKIVSRTSADGKTSEDRLLLLPDEPSGGRPIGEQYWSRAAKLSFMDNHSIDVSIVSPANPWLDFLSPSEAVQAALEVNADLEEYCATVPSSQSPSIASSLSSKFAPGTDKRLFAFGVLPLVEGIHIEALREAVKQIAELPHLKGLILGSRGIGKGLDDERLLPVWEEIGKEGLTVFLHPHYGFGADTNRPDGLYGDKENGHVLPLAMGFPMETTIAATRLILSGIFDRLPNLRLLLAHSGGALPALSSRLSSCVIHDPLVSSRLQHDVRYYLGKLYYDAVAYGAEELEFVAKTAGRARGFKRGLEEPKYMIDRKGTPGVGRMMFGTDHPFFPPITAEEQELQWRSVQENLSAIDSVESWTAQDKADVKGENAIRLFGLDV